jgi:HEAT repeat protein
MLLERPRPPVKAPPAPSRGIGLAGAPGPPRSPQQLAVEYLVISGREQAVEPLLRGFAVPKLRDWLARFVGELRDPRFVPPLIDVLAEENGRQSAVAALRMIGDRRAIEPIAEHLADKTWRVRFLAAEALLDMGDDRGKEALKTLLPAENENWHREVLRLRALAGDDEGISALVVELTPGGTLRPRDAADTLGEIRNVATIEPLAEALKNPDPNDCFAAAMAIAQMRHPKAIEKATALLKHDEPAMRVWGARILGWMKDPLGVDPLLGALRDKHAEVRQHASRAPVAIGDDRSLKAALAMLNNFDRDVRRYTAQALGPTRNPQVIEPLFTLVRDADSFVCQAAAEAILATHDPSAIKRLVMMIEPDNFAARALAASSTSFLSRYQSDACVLHELVVLTKDADASVRSKALLALQSARDRCALSPLIAALDDPDEEVRKTARDLLSRHHAQEPDVRNALKTGQR